MRSRYDMTVTGRVQGVGYRMSAKRMADQLRLSGWVTNHPDGSVRMAVEGEEPVVTRFIEWCRQGPFLANVNHIDLKPGTPEGLTGFEIRSYA